ncbi:MAG: PGPGW domain-containing protein [Actinomycetota bacterium]|nr:PGPGW domain-containing protein [Actinomycetota bacterium]
MGIVKRFAVTLLGVALLAAGATLMVLPGPGILLIVAGLAVLASEYVWAQRLLSRARKQAVQVQQQAVASRSRTAGSVLFALGMVALGVTMLVVDDVSWPVADDVVDRVWGAVPGAILIVTGTILLVTTYLTIRAARGEPTTYLQGRREHEEQARS